MSDTEYIELLQKVIDNFARFVCDQDLGDYIPMRDWMFVEYIRGITDERPTQACEYDEYQDW